MPTITSQIRPVSRLTPPRVADRHAAAWLRDLCVVPGLGIACFGQGIAEMAGFAADRFFGLWLCCALIVYHYDRLIPDAADAVNLPWRARSGRQRRRVHLTLIIVGGCGAAIFVSGTSLLTAALVTVGLAVCLAYSRPWPGCRQRIKQWRVVKTLFPPLAITTALVGLPVLGAAIAPRQLTGFALWSLLLLTVNVAICDLRDMPGDAATGVQTLTVTLGSTRTRWLLGGMLAAAASLTVPLAADWWLFAAAAAPVAWLAVALGLYSRLSREWWYYEYVIDGMLFMPIAVLGIGQTM